MGLEQILFLVILVVSLFFTYHAGKRVMHQINAGKGTPNLSDIRNNIKTTLVNTLLLRKTFKSRLIPSILHAFIALGFVMFLFVNLSDLVYFFTGARSFGVSGRLADVFRAKTELFSVLLLVGLFGMMIRRFILKPKELRANEHNHLSEIARKGINKDSMIVGAFIFIHSGARLLSEAFYLAQHENGMDVAQPITSALSQVFISYASSTLVMLENGMFWLSFGAILLFLPYFPASKHIHLFFAPINFVLKPTKRSIGEQSYIDLEDQSIEVFGAEKVSDLPFEQIIDAYACIMCFRCQDVCPPAQTGKLLSPATLMINKRYALNHAASDSILMTDLIPEEAVWACTSCAACIEICPVGNEPMRDILEVRRFLSLNADKAPRALDMAFKGMERNGNPWNTPRKDRLAWAKGVNLPTIGDNPEPELLWWVGCAPSTDPRAQKTSLALASILNQSGVNYAVLGEAESCTGDAARRAGREDIFFALATENIGILNEVPFKRVVTTCPHCFHALKNEYPAFGGNYEVIHHTELIQELIDKGSIQLERLSDPESITLHDPCYLSRHNHLTQPARESLSNIGATLIEMDAHAEASFCCGAGGAQYWMEEQTGTRRVSHARFDQAIITGAETIAVGCPFCMAMLDDAKKDLGKEIKIKDIAEIVNENMIK